MHSVPALPTAILETQEHTKSPGGVRPAEVHVALKVSRLDGGAKSTTRDTEDKSGLDGRVSATRLAWSSGSS